MSSLFDISKPYNKYVDDVLSGKILGCDNIKLACQRYKSWFNRDDIWFDYADVDRRIRLVSKLKHWKGTFNKKPFILLPYQQWIFASIFGWKWKDTSLRVTKNVLMFVARKNGKTALASALCITQILLDNNNGQEIYALANSGAQARILFEMNRNFTKSIDPDSIIFKRYRDSIKMPATDSIITACNSDAMTLDGLNASTFIVDEYHGAKTSDLYDVMKTSQGSQLQPLAIIITTAGFLLDGYPLYEMRKTCIEILKGEKQDDTQFTALYEQDPEDDWMDDEDSWIKSNPSLGATVQKSYLRDQVQTVRNQPSNEVNIKTKNFNMFCQSSEVWLSSATIDKVSSPIDLDDFKDEECYVGVDLAAVSDLTSFSLLFPPNPYRKTYPDKFVFKTFSYVPSSVLESVNGSRYLQWSKNDTFKVIQGNVTDYDTILEDQMHLSQNHNMQSIAYDSWNAVSWAVDAEKNGLPLSPYSQALGNFNRPTKQLERLILSERCVIDDDPCVKWCFNNVVLRIDHNDNCKPDKQSRENKIDPIIAMCEALGAYLDQNGSDIELV